MKKLLVLATLVALLGCAEKKAATPEEKWKGYCTSIGNAARTITLDRQNGITKKEALDYANKVTDLTTKTFLLSQIDKVYALTDEQLKSDKDAIMTQIKESATQECINTPHDPNKMPDYKPF
ncbi:hypothetical protein [Acinetobacter stercoris]|uniref:Lipoprotein n=1 Tax=Acinetobacter stercoris TaxID=2126983 RepID=A0A2U3N0S4_9GAMM|nr:hypothetical protein [Acinetobacter stercoris]SPL71244.1 hypothetical protein KPC_2422 [Acinetobacter stercoris]